MLEANILSLQKAAIGCALLLAISACATLLDTDHPLAGRIWDPAEGIFVTPEQLLRRASMAETVLLGETHDNPRHHRLQAEILTSLLNRTAKPVLLMEQFDIDQQAAIDDERIERKDIAPLMRGWESSQYRPILEIARNHGLVLRAANLPREKLRPVVRDGYAALAAGEVERLALRATWDDAREKFMINVIEASHCGKVSAALRDGLVRAQRLRDATMADSVLGTIDRSQVVFILGRGHARRDVGVPRYLEIRRPGTRLLSIGMVEVSAGKIEPAEYESDRAGEGPAFDLVWFTPRAERPDPCLAFGK